MRHPASHIVVSIELAAMVILLPGPFDATVLAVLFACVLLEPARTQFGGTRGFIKLLAAAAFFLFLIHAIEWFPPGFSRQGFSIALSGFLKIAIPFTVIIHLAKNIRPEELYALLIDCRMPPALILILLRTVWLVPRLTGRIRDVTEVQRMRGLRIESHADRLRALVPTLSPVFSSMVDEIAQNSLVLTARGFLRPGPKTHITVLNFRFADGFAVILATLALGVVCCFRLNI